jgi:oligosaccharyltransferase complex subunit alpha (ribophorin I)
MRPFAVVSALCGLVLSSSSIVSAQSTAAPLPADFKPPQVFKNVNLVRNTNLEKGYARETINVVVENVNKDPQSEYYLSFPSEVFDRVGGLEVRNKKEAEKGRLDVEAVEIDSLRLVCHCRCQWPPMVVMTTPRLLIQEQH